MLAHPWAKDWALPPKGVWNNLKEEELAGEPECYGLVQETAVIQTSWSMVRSRRRKYSMPNFEGGADKREIMLKASGAM
jgi:hypothetical protein